MAVRAKAGAARIDHQPGPPKKTRQGISLHTNLASSSRNGRKKRYRGQGKG
jgi:hypothetical protein